MTLRFTFRQLEYLVAVGDLGSILLASQRVNVSSPSISAAITHIEAELGVQIFVRHHAQGLSLTPGGRQIYNGAKRILDNARALGDLASEIADTARGPIGVGSLITVAPLISASIRRSFEAEYPDADVTLREGHQVDLLHMLGRAEIDVAITYDLEIPEDVFFEPMSSLPPFVMLPQQHFLASRDALKLADLAEEPMVLLDIPLTRDYFLSMFQTAGIKPMVSERTSDMSVARSLVANGFGFGLINMRMKTTVSPDGEPLVFLPIEGEHRPMVLGLATKLSAYRSRIVAAFCEHMKTRICEAGLVVGAKKL